MTMNASKENAKFARHEFDRLVENDTTIQALYPEAIANIRMFFDAAIRKLPSEAAYAADRVSRGEKRSEKAARLAHEKRSKAKVGK